MQGCEEAHLPLGRRNDLAAAYLSPNRVRHSASTADKPATVASAGQKPLGLLLIFIQFDEAPFLEPVLHDVGVAVPGVLGDV